MSKDLLRLENEFRDQLPRYREKPNIVKIQQPTKLKDNIANFLNIAKNANQKQDASSRSKRECDTAKKGPHVEMDIVMAQVDN